MTAPVHPKNSLEIPEFSKISLGIFLICFGLAYLLDAPKGTLFIVAGVLFLIECLYSLLRKIAEFDPLGFIIGILLCGKGVSDLLGYNIKFIPLVIAAVGLVIVLSVIQRYFKSK